MNFLIKSQTNAVIWKETQTLAYLIFFLSYHSTSPHKREGDISLCLCACPSPSLSRPSFDSKLIFCCNGHIKSYQTKFFPGDPSKQIQRSFSNTLKFLNHWTLSAVFWLLSFKFLQIYINIVPLLRFWMTHFTNRILLITLWPSRAIVRSGKCISGSISHALLW